MPDFTSILKEYLDRISALRELGASEDTMRDAFLSFLRDAFPRLRSGFEPIFLERHIPGLRVRGGFADALYGDLIFEFKRRLDGASREEGKDELRRYLSNQARPERFFGILTDGKTLEVYVLHNGELAKTDELRLDAGAADLAKLWLDCYLFHERQLEPTADDIARRFGESSPTFWHSLRILKELWQRTGGEPSAQTKFAEWQSLLAIVYGSSIEDEELFLRHTYLALFARILAFVAVKRRAPSEDEIPGIMTGEAFERMGFDNFVADDFFTWIAHATEFLRSLATRLASAYDLTAIREDLLKELYQELVDPQTRHDLGEFYTPDWLAELTLRQAGFPSPGTSLLDPACGSGTFLFTAVRLLREAGLADEELVEFCASRLAGIDVHPLAVVIAKTNLILALGDSLRRSRRRFRLPVYMADALMVMQQRERAVLIPVDTDAIARRACKPKEYALPSAFWLPPDLAEYPEAFHATVNALLDFADPDIREEAARQGFATRLRELGVREENLWLWHSNLRLMRWLLRQPATDTVWRFVLQNAYQPEMLARRKFAFVIGNPPWLSYRFIQKPDYQERVRELVFRYGLLDKRDWHLFTQMEMATLFFAFCADRYLAEGGTLAFVMPRSILTGAKQHDRFRRRFVAFAERLIDCEKVVPLFNVPSCVVVWKKEETAGEIRREVPMLHLEGVLPRKNVDLAEAQRFLSRSETSYAPPVAARSSPYLDRIVNGATIYPRCFWFVRPSRAAVIIDQERPQLETDQDKFERTAKRPWKNICLSGSVEAEFLFTTLLSDDLIPFGWRRLSLIVLPVVWPKQAAREGRLIGFNAAISMGKTGLAEWLRKAEIEWHRYRKLQVDLLDNLNWHEKLTCQRPIGVWKVVYNQSGTHLCSCVIDATISLWRAEDLPVCGFIADNTTYWMETTNEDEAFYLCTVLNSPMVDRMIKPFQTKGAFGTSRGKGERHIQRRPFEVLPIPLYDAGEEKHLQLAELSRRCHAKVAEFIRNADPSIFRQPIGRLRQQIRQELLPQELAEIDAYVEEILQGC